MSWARASLSLQRSADLEWWASTEVVWDRVTGVQLGLKPTTEKDVSVLCVKLGDSPLELGTCMRDWQCQYAEAWHVRGAGQDLRKCLINLEK
jgi:hypothetical protein